VKTALPARGCPLIVVDHNLVADVPEILTTLCSRRSVCEPGR